MLLSCDARALMAGCLVAVSYNVTDAQFEIDLVLDLEFATAIRGVFIHRFFNKSVVAGTVTASFDVQQSPFLTAKMIYVKPPGCNCC
jgi:hypothetical protein